MKNLLIVFSIFLAAFFVRSYNFRERITFGSEQARSLYVSAGYINDKFSLLGQEYFRANSNGHKLFASSLFNYSLIPLLLIFKYDPLGITFFFVVLNLFTGLVLYILTKKYFNENVAALSLFLLLFNSYMIYHSMFIWILNYLPLIGILSFYQVFKVVKKKSKSLDILVLGILSGIGIGMEYLYILPIILILFILFKYSQNRFKNICLFILGGLLGDFTQIIFDFKHNFYHTKVLWQYAVDTFSGSSDAGFIYYHFLYLWPVFAIFGAIVLWMIYKKYSKILAISLVFVYLFINLQSSLINFKAPVGMPVGLTFSDLKHTAQIISNDVNVNFNVVYGSLSILEDVNGDGLVDIIDNSENIILNTGNLNGWKEIGSWNSMGSNNAVFVKNYNGKNGVILKMIHNGDWVQSIRYYDVNGDSWLDTVYTFYSGYGTETWINRGLNQHISDKNLKLPFCEDSSNRAGCFSAKYGERKQDKYFN